MIEDDQGTAKVKEKCGVQRARGEEIPLVIIILLFLPIFQKEQREHNN